MCNIEDSNTSYEPTIWNEISKDIYNQHHSGDFGSSIILEKLCPDNYSFNNKEETITNFREYIQDAYSKIIKNRGLTINIFDKQKEVINPKEDFFEDHDCVLIWIVLFK